MKKLKNTATNKLLVAGSIATIGGVSGFLLSKKSPEFRKPLVIGGILLGLFITTGVISWVVEKD